MAVVAFAPTPLSCIPRTCGEAMNKYLKLAQGCLRHVHMDHLTEMLKPVYSGENNLKPIRKRVNILEQREKNFTHTSKTLNAGGSMMAQYA